MEGFGHRMGRGAPVHKFINEFREFINRGNVMDMAVGVIIGGAFKAIADSLTADIIMPILGIFTSEVSFADLSVTVGGR